MTDIHNTASIAYQLASDYDVLYIVGGAHVRGLVGGGPHVVTQQDSATEEGITHPRCMLRTPYVCRAYRGDTLLPPACVTPVTQPKNLAWASMKHFFNYARALVSLCCPMLSSRLEPSCARLSGQPL